MLLEVKLSSVAKRIVENCKDKQLAEIIILYFSGNFSAYCKDSNLKLDAEAMNLFIDEVEKGNQLNVNAFTVATNVDYVINHPYRIAVY